MTRDDRQDILGVIGVMLGVLAIVVAAMALTVWAMHVFTCSPTRRESCHPSQQVAGRWLQAQRTAGS
jgi:hypothetical protein